MKIILYCISYIYTYNDIYICMFQIFLLLVANVLLNNIHFLPSFIILREKRTNASTSDE